MNAPRGVVLGLGLGLLLAAPGAAQEEPPTWHAQALAQSDGGLNLTYFWSKGPKLRAETVIGGHRVVTIVNGELYYAYDAMLRRGVAIRRSKTALAQDRADRRPFGRELEILLQQGAEKVREEVLRGSPCNVYRITDDFGKRELWVSQEAHRLPVRLEIFSRASGEGRTTDYANWVGGMPLPEGFFQPEPGIELQSYSLEDYVRLTLTEGPVGPVPVLYADLLHGGEVQPPPQ